MSYIVDNLTVSSQSKSCNCNSDLILKNKITLPEKSKYFQVNNLFGEIVSDYQRLLARINLGIKDIEDLDVYSNANGTYLKVSYKDGYETITKDILINRYGVCNPLTTSKVKENGLVIINGLIVGEDIPEGYVVNKDYGIAYQKNSDTSILVYNLSDKAQTIVIDNKTYKIGATRTILRVDVE